MNYYLFMALFVPIGVVLVLSQVCKITITEKKYLWVAKLKKIGFNVVVKIKE